MERHPDSASSPGFRADPDQAQTAPRRNWLHGLVNFVVAVVVLAVAAGTFFLSYPGVHAIARQGGVSGQLARFYPALFDAVLVIACVAAVMLRDARWWARCWAWLVAIVILGAIGAADVLHAMSYGLRQRPTEGVVAAAPVAAVLLAFSLFLTLLRQSRPRPAQAAPGQGAARGLADGGAAGQPTAPMMFSNVETVPALAAGAVPRPPAPPIALPAGPAAADLPDGVDDDVDRTPDATARVAETPDATAPVAEVPDAEVPVAEAPVAEAPDTTAPVAEAPVEQAPIAQAPIAEVPVAQVPIAQVPIAEVPVAEALVAPPTQEIPTLAADPDDVDPIDARQDPGADAAAEEPLPAAAEAEPDLAHPPTEENEAVGPLPLPAEAESEAEAEPTQEWVPEPTPEPLAETADQAADDDVSAEPEPAQAPHAIRYASSAAAEQFGDEDWEAEVDPALAGQVYPVLTSDPDIEVPPHQPGQSQDLEDDAPPFATAPFASVPRLNRVRVTPTPPTDDADED
jgi:hypothetical protein